MGHWRHLPNINSTSKCPTQMSQSAADETFEWMHQAGFSACLHWITIAPRRSSLRPSLKAKTVQSARPYSRGSPRVMSGWLTLKKAINGKSGRRLGLIPPARPAGIVSADIRFHCPSARYISPRDAACAAIKKPTNDYPGCTILPHPILTSRARTIAIPNGRIGCWRHRNSSALFSVKANQQSVALFDHLIARVSRMPALGRERAFGRVRARIRLGPNVRH